jgi:eukaryotic-like serine/threonine-protein kinase
MTERTDRAARLNQALEGRYVLERELGEGGMATVYLAHDLRHDRRVALKLLRPELAAVVGADRFLAEIRTTANLQHPNILPLFDSGIVPAANEAEGELLFYVMPYVEGESLRDRLDREGELPVEEAVRIAAAVADALGYAHRQEVVHRDIKPENILLHEGRPLVADFGIALAADRAGGPRLTETGLSLGTPLYMSPEQASGERRVDARTDVYALGAVLYEMLVGTPPHRGPGARAVLAQILTEEPRRVRELRRAVPPNVDAVVARALEKLPADRFSSAEELARALQDPGFRDGGMGSDGAPPGRGERPYPAARGSGMARAAGRGGSRRMRVGFGVAVLVAVGVPFWSLTRPTIIPPQDVVRFAIPLPSGQVFPIEAGLPPILAVSPGGEWIVYASRGPDGDRLYLRRRQDLLPVPLPGTEGAIGPFFSPDGEWIGFASAGALRKMPLAGGVPRVLAPAPNLRGASWGLDDRIVYAPDWQGQLFTVSSEGGDARPLTTLDLRAGEDTHLAPHVLPDGKNALTGVRVQPGRGDPARWEVQVVEMATGSRRSLVEGQNPAYLASGHLVFGRGTSVFAAGFDLSRLELTGSPVPVLAGVRSDDQDMQFAVSRSGTLAYVPENASVERYLMRVDREGRSRPLIDEPGEYSHPRISPDGRRVVFAAGGELWMHDVSRGTRTRLGARGWRPIWSADGRSITFGAVGGRLYSMWMDGSREPELFLEPERGLLYPLAWSRDGRVLAYSNAVPETGRDVWMFPVGGEPTPFLITPRDERAAMFSPDGRWVVYAEKEVGREEVVYVQPYAGPGDRLVVSRGGGIEPVWSPTGREIFYRSVDGRRMMAVEIQTEPSVSVGTPYVLFEGSYPLLSSFFSDYDVWPDGNEFLMVAAASEGATPGVVVVINWLNEVRSRLAAPE